MNHLTANDWIVRYKFSSTWFVFRCAILWLLSKYLLRYSYNKNSFFRVVKFSSRCSKAYFKFISCYSIFFRYHIFFQFQFINLKIFKILNLLKCLYTFFMYILLSVCIYFLIYNKSFHQWVSIFIFLPRMLW